MWASWRGHTDTVNHLLQHGPNVNAAAAKVSENLGGLSMTI